MWLPDAVLLACQRNGMVPLGFTLVDDTDQSVIDITGCSVIMAIATSAGVTPIVTIAATVDDPTQGGFEITIDGSAFSSLDGAQETIYLAYDVRLTDGDSNEYIIMRGPMLVEPGVNT